MELNALEQINAGTTKQRVEAALKEVAIGVANTQKQRTVTLTFTIKPQANTEAQVNIDAKVAFKKPVTKGSRSEDHTDSTPMFVSREGLSSIPEQPVLDFDKDSKVTDISRTK